MTVVGPCAPAVVFEMCEVPHIIVTCEQVDQMNLVNAVLSVAVLPPIDEVS